MAQKTTYTKAQETKADRIAKAERTKEKARIEKAGRLASLNTVVDAEVLEVAAEIVAERKANGAPVDTVKLEAIAKARVADREDDKALYEKKMARRTQLIRNFYNFSKSAENAFLEFAELSADMAAVCKRLNKPNPIRTSVMGVSDGTGVIVDPIRHTEEVWRKFIMLYRTQSEQIDMDTWERLP